MGVEMMAISAVISAAGAVMGGMAAANQADYQAKVAQQNAQIAEQKKQMELSAGADTAAKAAQQERAQHAAIIGSEAARGVNVNSGSALAVQQGQAQVSMSDQLAIGNDTAKKAWGEDIAANSYQNQSKLYSMEASNSMISGGIKAAGSLFSGASKMDTQYGFFG